MDSKKSRELSLHLPEELTEEILSRLSAKSLLRFRCVSKSWRSLIGSDRFVKTHLVNSSKNAALSHHMVTLNLNNYNKEQQCSRSYFNYTPIFLGVKIVGCCNGLVCIIKPECILLWNPTIRITKELPPTENGHRPFFVSKYGFGWDESSGAYKVLVVGVWMSKVYSSRTNSWKTVEFGNFDSVHAKAQFASGKLHWLRVKNNGGMNVCDIVTFDLKSEEFGEMELPCPCHSTMRLGVDEGSLCVVCYNKGDVWVRKEECWVKVRDAFVYEPCQIIPFVVPVCRGVDAHIVQMVHNRQEVDMLWFLMDKIKSSLGLNIYVQSLVSPVFDKV